MSKKIAFVGSGMIGAGLAANALLNGFDCVIYDVVEPEKIEKTLKSVMDIMTEAEAITAGDAEKALAKAAYSNDLAKAVEGAVFVQECVPERLDLKRSIYRQIQEANPDAVIASSTSGMMPSALQEGAIDPKKILVGHPYNPSYLLPLIEVCGPTASQESVDFAMETYKAMGKVPVLCRKEATGFVVNNLSWAAMDAAKKVVLDGVCSVEDMDKAIMFGPGMRMAVTGQILTMSLGVQGGLRAAAAKYGKEPNEEDCILADGVDAAIANRPAEQGNSPEDVAKWRDKMFAKILKLHGLL